MGASLLPPRRSLLSNAPADRSGREPRHGHHGHRGRHRDAHPCGGPRSDDCPTPSPCRVHRRAGRRRTLVTAPGLVTSTRATLGTSVIGTAVVAGTRATLGTSVIGTAVVAGTRTALGTSVIAVRALDAVVAAVAGRAGTSVESCPRPVDGCPLAPRAERSSRSPDERPPRARGAACCRTRSLLVVRGSVSSLRTPWRTPYRARWATWRGHTTHCGMQKWKRGPCSAGPPFRKVCSAVLLSHTVTSAVPSALKGLAGSEWDRAFPLRYDSRNSMEMSVRVPDRVSGLHSGPYFLCVKLSGLLVPVVAVLRYVQPLNPVVAEPLEASPDLILKHVLPA